ncbi:MAG: rhamnogalacturonan acetylesterase [Opitutaceae bacterium]|nr:rhamnogalacturonan acetylesterase [Opitutaceae bacterium]
MLRPLLPLLILFVAGACQRTPPLSFDLGPRGISRDTLYTRDRGYGFEPGASATSFHFTARVPREGNHRVTVTVGSDTVATDMAIKTELRRLMVEKITAPHGGSARVSFIVNTRTPAIPATGDLKAGAVRLKMPRESVQEAWAWDDALTLEFVGPAPAVRRIEIEPAEVPTIFLLGDSTVCDQSKEPYNSWGQMITRWFSPAVAIANHGESGETYRDSIGRRRLDKIASVMRPGDWLIMQFGHNDQKQIAAGSGGPFTTYKDEIARHIAVVRARGGVPVIVSPMERRGFDEAGRVRGSLTDYAEAARQAAQEHGVAFIDLNAMSKVLYAALGPEQSARAFATPRGVVDNTHHNNFGSYQLAQCIAQAIRAQGLPIAKFLAADFKGFDPSRSDDPDTFKVPASADFTNERPLGDEANR